MWSSGFLLSSVRRVQVLTLQFLWSGAVPAGHSPTSRRSHQPSSGWCVKHQHHHRLGADIFKASCIKMIIQNPGWHPNRSTGRAAKLQPPFTLIRHIGSRFGAWLSPCKPGTTTSPRLEQLGGDSRAAGGAKHVGLPPTELSLSQGQASPRSGTSSGTGGSKWVPEGTKQGCTTHSSGLAHLHHNPQQKKWYTFHKHMLEHQGQHYQILKKKKKNPKYYLMNQNNIFLSFLLDQMLVHVCTMYQLGKPLQSPKYSW